MLEKRRVLINSLASAAQVVVVGGAYFVLYPFLLRVLGEEPFGVWALVLATTSASSIANLGLAGSTVKFVAQYLARGDAAYVGELIQTALLSVALALGLLLLAAYPAFVWLLAYLVGANNPDMVPAAQMLLPYALASFWLTSVAGVIQSSVEGFQRVDLRSLLTIGTTLLYLALAFWLVPEGQLIGLAQAQVLQAAVLALASWLVLHRLIPALPWLPVRWTRRAFSEMLRYSINFQAIALCQMLFLPTTSALISRLGGVGVVAYFEMAQRMVVQLRALVVTAHQAIVPTLADLQEKAPDLIRTVYIQSLRALLFLLILFLPFLIAMMPFIAEIYVGSYNARFVLFADLLCVGWFLNTLSNPAYFANLGVGTLHWNVAGHLTIGLLNAALGLLFGLFLGGTGVVLGFVLALLAGSFLTAFMYHKEHVIPFVPLIQRESIWLSIASLVGLALITLLYYRLESWPLLPLALLALLSYLGITLPFAWRHPCRHQLVDWISSLRMPKRADPSAIGD